MYPHIYILYLFILNVLLVETTCQLVGFLHVLLYSLGAAVFLAPRHAVPLPNHAPWTRWGSVWDGKKRPCSGPQETFDVLPVKDGFPY